MGVYYVLVGSVARISPFSAKARMWVCCLLPHTEKCLFRFCQGKYRHRVDHSIFPPMHWGTSMRILSWNSCMARSFLRAPSGSDGSQCMIDNNSESRSGWGSVDRRAQFPICTSWFFLCLEVSERAVKIYSFKCN